MLSLQRFLHVGRGERYLLTFGIVLVPVVLLAAEGLLAAAGRSGLTDSFSSGIDRLHRYSEVYGWEPRPGTYREDGRVITINRRGYRGPEQTGSPAPGQRRVVVLGDSVAFGLYMQDDETYSAELDRRDDGLQVINLAVQGYSPGQSLLRLERLGLSLGPDVVVLGFCLANDFADAMVRTFLFDDAHPQPYFTLEEGRLVKHDAHLRLTRRERVALWLQDHSRLYRRVLSRPHERGQDPGDWQARRREAMEDREATLSLVTELVVRMRDMAASRGAEFLVLLHPERPGRRGENWADAFSARLADEGVSTIDLLQSYEERGLEFDDVALDGQGHLSPPGHAETAAILEEALRTTRRASRRATLTSTTPRRPR